MSLQTIRDRSNRCAEVKIFRPQTETDLIEYFKQCEIDETPVTIVAGRTSLTGSCIPQVGVGVDIMSLQPIKFFPAGITTNRRVYPPTIFIKALDAELEKEGLTYLPTPGYKQCTLGGNVATNASGPRTFSFGATREHVWFLRVVLISGEVLELHRGENISQGENFVLQTVSGTQISIPCPNYDWPNIKNATGLYAQKPLDLIDLFIGSEGLLGVITQIGIEVKAFKDKIMTQAHFFTSETEALACAEKLREYGFDRKKMSGFISVEFMDQGALKLTDSTEYHHYEAALEIEYFASDKPTINFWQQQRGQYDIPTFLEGSEVARFRYSIPLNLSERLREYKTVKVASDFAVPVQNFGKMYSAYKQAMVRFDAAKNTDDVSTAIWGHIGDCHLHLNFIPQSLQQEALAQQLYLELAQKCINLGGVLSAEHGIGKKCFADGRTLLEVQNPKMILEIAQIKKSLDFLNLLNRGNMIQTQMIKRPAGKGRKEV